MRKIKSRRDKYNTYVSKALTHEEKATQFDTRAKQFYPVKCDFFLKAARHSRLNAKFWELASKHTDNDVEKSVALSNMHIALFNFHKSKGNYYYYNNDVERARTFFIRALKENQVVEKIIPWHHVTPDLALENKAHSSNIAALVSNCEAASAKTKNNWEKASKLYQKSKKLWEEHKDYLKRLGKETKTIDAIVLSTESEIQICLSMIDLKKAAFQDALNHIDSAQQAAEKAFEIDPSWGYFRILLSNAMKLQGLVQTLPMLNAFKEKATILDRYDDLIVSMASRLFEVETERYLKEKYNYTLTFSPYKPPYLEGKQIDVYALKEPRNRTITACECKLRFNGSPLTVEEVDNFAKKIAILRQYQMSQAEKEGVTCKVHAWIITNTNTAEDETWKIAKNNKIKLKRAVLSKNFTKDAYWKITELVNL